MDTCEQESVIKLVELPPLTLLEREWRELESRSDASFFTSWSWIGCWLSCLPSHIQPRLLRAARGKEVVGLGVLVSRDFWRHRIFPVKGLYLNATGDPLLDQITIEYNGFLVDRRLQKVLVPQLYQYLATSFADWDELHLDGVTEDIGFQFQNLIGLQTQRKRECFNYVDLDEVRLSDGDYLSLLGSSTRYNIRRSIKEFTKQGPVTLAVARTVGEALEFLSGLKKLHQARWLSRGLPGAFGYPFFESFHEELICARFDCGEIQLIRTNAGDRIIGYLYNFLHRGIVHNYQTGFDYTICKRQYSPGLVTHSMAIEYNTSQGHRVYDLMAGSSQYKQAIGIHLGKMDWIVLQRDRLKFRIENGIRQIKHSLQSIVKA